MIDASPCSAPHTERTTQTHPVHFIESFTTCCTSVSCSICDSFGSADNSSLLRCVLESLPLIIWAIDAQGIFKLSEGKVLEQIGLAPGKAVGQSVFELYADYPDVINAVERMLSGEEFAESTEIAAHHFDVYYTPLKAVDGTVCGGIGISLEVSRQHHAERKQIEQEKLFEAIFTSLPHPLIIASPERTIQRINPAAEELFGYSNDEICGSSTQILYADEEQFNKAGIAQYQDGQSLAFDMNCRDKQGTTFISESVCTKILNRHGSAWRLIGMHRDVTKERHATAVLQWHEQTLQTMLDAAPTMALLVDRDGVVLYANQRLADHLATPLPELVGSDLKRFSIDSELCQTRNNHINQALESGTPASFIDFRNSCWFEHHISPLPDANGGYSRAAIYIQDITTRIKREEDEREQIAQELHDVVSEMLQATQPEQTIHDTLHGKPLSPQESRVLKEIASGLSTKMIAYKFGVSTKTIESQRLSIMRKLRLFNIVDLTKYALREGITTLDIGEHRS